MSPKFYIAFWLSVMGVCVVIGGILIWRLNVLITLLIQLLEKK